MDAMSDFASLLRSWRNRVTPLEAGLPAGGDRRTPGLRREELAALAQVSVDYIVRLEQGRAQHPSPSMLASLARALRLSDEERDHLYRSAGVAAPSSGVVPRHITPGVQRMVDRLDDVPLAVFTASWDLLAWNRMWTAMVGDPSVASALDRNIAWKHFSGGQSPVAFSAEHESEFGDDLVADLRAASTRYPDDVALAGLVDRLLGFPAFSSRWSEARIAMHRSPHKTLHTAVGPVTVDCDVLSVPGSDLRLVVYTTAPGSEDASRLALLGVAGVLA